MERPRWVLLIYRIPREPSRHRVAVWRKLRDLGALYLQDGVAALPEDAVTREQMEWLQLRVWEAGGEATLWEARPGTLAEEGELVGAFRAAREEAYGKLIAGAERVRRMAEMGGGVLREFGCYPVHWCRSLLREEPEVISTEATLTKGGLDEDMTALLRFPSGVLAEIEARMSPGWDMYARFHIRGDRGSVEAINNLLPHRGHSIVERIDGGLREHTLAGGTTFDYQLAMLVEAVTSGRPVSTEGADPIGNMATIDAIYAAAGIGRQ